MDDVSLILHAPCLLRHTYPIQIPPRYCLLPYWYPTHAPAAVQVLHTDNYGSLVELKRLVGNDTATEVVRLIHRKIQGKMKSLPKTERAAFQEWQYYR